MLWRHIQHSAYGSQCFKLQLITAQVIIKLPVVIRKNKNKAKLRGSVLHPAHNLRGGVRQNPEMQLLVLMHIVKFRKIIGEPRSRVRRKIDVTIALFLLLTWSASRLLPSHASQ